MDQLVSLEKVACFATTGSEKQLKLLVIRHPTAGTQVPAGTVEEEERPVDAAVREFWEETGIQAREMTEIGRLEIKIPPPDVVLLGGALHSSTGVSGNEKGLRRGLRVRVLEENATATLVVHEEKDYNVEPPITVKQMTGWVSNLDIAHRVTRTLFKVEIPDVMRADGSWNIDADGQSWVLEWAELDQSLKLFGDQQAWLQLVLSILRHG